MENSYNTSTFLKEWAKITGILSIIIALSWCLNSSWDTQNPPLDTTKKKERTPDTTVYDLKDQPHCLFEDLSERPINY